MEEYGFKSVLLTSIIARGVHVCITHIFRTMPSTDQSVFVILSIFRINRMAESAPTRI